MIQLLAEDVARERYDAILHEAAEERRAAQQLKVTRARRRVDRARQRLAEALEEAYALPARPNPVTAGRSRPSDDVDSDFRGQLV